MGSRKPAANAKRLAAFKASLGDMDDLFEREEDRQDALAARREDALREKACERKKRYTCRSDAEEAVRLCAEHGTLGLRCYKCRYCGGWHLTSKAPRA